MPCQVFPPVSLKQAASNPKPGCFLGLFFPPLFSNLSSACVANLVDNMGINLPNKISIEIRIDPATFCRVNYLVNAVCIGRL